MTHRSELVRGPWVGTVGTLVGNLWFLKEILTERKGNKVNGKSTRLSVEMRFRTGYVPTMCKYRLEPLGALQSQESNPSQVVGTVSHKGE